MKIINKIEKILEENHIFLTGGGGVGKSYLTEQIIKKYKEQNRQVIALGSTGISAVNIGGQTIHSFFVFGICQNTEELIIHDRYNKNRIKELNKILQNLDLLIIDEISMVSAFLMEMIRFRLNSAKFSGRILFVGDFFQLPPVNNKNSFSSLFDEVYAFESSAWNSFEPVVLELNISKRTEDLEFFSILKEIRRGILDDKILTYLSSLRENTKVYNNNPTILFGTNAEANKMNKEKLNELEGTLYKLLAKETLHDKSLHIKKLESWKNSLNVPFELELKIGANIIFCTNKWGKYYNGEQGVVKDINDEYLLIEKNNSLVKVELHEFVMSENIIDNGSIKNRPILSIFQFPVKLSYAITIHKSQSMSIENLVCDIHNIFETNQFYVAISRAKSAKGLCIKYNRSDFDLHIKRCLAVDEKVRDFYESVKAIKLD